MKNILLRALKYFLRFWIILILLTATYLLFAITLTIIPSNTNTQQVKEGIPIYLVSNGFHMDLVLPLETSQHNWANFIDLDRFELPSNFSLDDPSSKKQLYLAFGWGDKGFFFDTPQIQDLTLATTLTAVFLPSPSVMHVMLYFSQPEGSDTRQILLSPHQYKKLVTYIKKSFKSSDQGRVVQLAGTGYEYVVDNFYLGEGSYSLFTTCNSWVNAGLKEAEVKTATWAPFDKCILYHFE